MKNIVLGLIFGMALKGSTGDLQQTRAIVKPSMRFSSLGMIGEAIERMMEMFETSRCYTNAR